MSDSLPVHAAPPARPAAPKDSSFVSLHLDESGATDFAFSLDRYEGRVSRSAIASVALHALAIIAAIGLSLVAPALSIESPPQQITQQVDLVWLPEEGPGGGGGGGGNQSPEPPPKVELPGKDKLSLPVAPPPKLEPPKEIKKEDTPPLEGVSVPAMTMASGLETIPGTPDGTGLPDSRSLGPGSGGGAGTGRGTGIGPGQGSGLGPGSGGGTGGGVYRPGSGVTTPRPLKEVKPQYTAEAMRAKIQGQVWLEVIVLPDGGVGSVEVVRSLDSVFGLDQEAIKAARQWRFVPGTRQGQPVPVLVTIEMTFTLR